MFTMDKFHSAIFTAALLCFFTVSLARKTPDSNESATTNSNSAALRLSTADPKLRLPIKTDTNTNSAVAAAIPLTEVAFRPLDRQFNVRSKRPCRHHFNLYPTMKQNEGISYGNSMNILPDGENSDFQQPIFRGGGKRIPSLWMKMQHHRLNRHRRDDRDNKKEKDRAKKSAFKRFDSDRFDQAKKWRKQFRVREEEAEKKNKAGFMIRVRKFLTNYV